MNRELYEPGSGLKGCTGTQHVPWGWWFDFRTHWDEGGTLLWIFTTWYCVGPYILLGPKLQIGVSAPGKFWTFDMAVTKVRRLRFGPALVAAWAKSRMALHQLPTGPCSSM